MGNYIGVSHTAEEIRLMNQLRDTRYKSFYNNLIKRNITSLSKVVDLLKETKDEDPCCEKANELLLSIYEDNKLEPRGRDNWFCYHLGNKINQAAGIDPLNEGL